MTMSEAAKLPKSVSFGVRAATEKVLISHLHWKYFSLSLEEKFYVESFDLITVLPSHEVPEA